MLLKKTVCAVVFFSIFVLSSAALAAQEFVLRGGQACKVASDGSEKPIDGAEVEIHEGDNGKIIYTLAVDPTVNDIYKDSKEGIYFFDKNENFISFLPRKDAGMSYARFNPEMTQFVLDSGTYVDREYLLYQFEGLKQKKSFYGAPQLVWLDNMRFGFTLIDTEKKGRRENADIPGWLSVVMYDTAMEELFIIIPATDTADYMLESVDDGKIRITELFVKNKTDWADEEKVETREITEAIPAAG